MKAPAEFVARLRRANGSPEVTVDDIVREAQADAFQDGYTQATKLLLGIAQATQERVDGVLERAEHRRLPSN